MEYGIQNDGQVRKDIKLRALFAEMFGESCISEEDEDEFDFGDTGNTAFQAIVKQSHRRITALLAMHNSRQVQK